MNQRNRKLLTPKKAAEKYGLDKGKIYSWIRQKRFAYIKPEKEILFWEEDFLSFLQANTIPANPDFIWTEEQTTGSKGEMGS